MKATLTLKMKLEITEAASNSLLETQKAHVVALNQTSDVAFEKKVFNSVIVDEALKANAGTIVIEDLKGIRERIKVAKKQRLIHPGWPFSSLFLKITHVASKDGIKVESVDARNTFRTCRCGQVDKANRTTQSTFRCFVCGYAHNADYVASHNVVARYVERGCGAVTHRIESADLGKA